MSAPPMMGPSATSAAEPNANANANQQAPIEGSEQQLRIMKLGDLKSKARAIGCGQEAVDHADFEDDPKQVVIELILAKKAALAEQHEDIEFPCARAEELRQTVLDQQTAHEEARPETSVVASAPEHGFEDDAKTKRPAQDSCIPRQVINELANFLSPSRLKQIFQPWQRLLFLLKKTALAPLEKDPRWDRLGLQSWFTDHCIKLVEVGFVKDLRKRGKRFPHYSKLPSDDWKHWTSKDDRNLYVFTHSSDPDAKFGHYPDKDGALLEYLCRSLSECRALDRDLLFFAYVSMDSPEWDDTEQNILHWRHEDRKKRKHCEKEMYRLFTYAGIHHIWKWNPAHLDDHHGKHISKVWRNKWLEMHMAFSLYCQMCWQISVDAHRLKEIICVWAKFARTDIVDAASFPEGEEDIAPDVDKALVSAISICTKLADTAPVPREMRAGMKYFGKVVGAIVPPTEDVAGFNFFCERTGIAWVLVEYLEELAVRKGPFPRRQDLEKGRHRIHVGAPPEDAQLFVVSHCWDSEFHPNPSGEKLHRLLEILRTYGAKDSDLVFMDYLSMAQRPRGMPAIYFAAHGIEGTQRERTRNEEDQFLYFMHDMSRLLSYRRCRVVILPDRGSPTKFPESPTAWGRVSDRDYENRGWCVNEYAIAKQHNRIINANDPDVLRVDESRRWPTKLEHYSEIMNETTAAGQLRVTFTLKGDKKNAMLNFYRYCFSLLAQEATG